MSLADLFRARSQLIVYHFMFGPNYTAGSPACSAIADGFDGFVVHLANHDVTLCAVSRAPTEKLQAYKRRMGWGFPKLTTTTNVSVDGVMQGLGGPDEDRRVHLPRGAGHRRDDFCRRNGSEA